MVSGDELDRSALALARREPELAALFKSTNENKIQVRVQFQKTDTKRIFISSSCQDKSVSQSVCQSIKVKGESLFAVDVVIHHTVVVVAVAVLDHLLFISVSPHCPLIVVSC